jgi:hypothetical protein
VSAVTVESIETAGVNNDNVPAGELRTGTTALELWGRANTKSCRGRGVMPKYIILFSPFALMACGRTSLLDDDFWPVPSGPDANVHDAARSAVDDAGSNREVGSGAEDANVGGDEAGSGADAGIDIDSLCLVSDNKFVLAGDDFVHSGPPLIIEGGSWFARVDNFTDGLPSGIALFIVENWTASFGTISLGKPLLPGVYLGAQRAGFQGPNRPGLDVSGDGRGCDEVTGQFRVIEMTAIPAGNPGAWKPPTLKSFTATFEQHCEGRPAFNIGCVHFAQ